MAKDENGKVGVGLMLLGALVAVASPALLIVGEGVALAAAVAGNVAVLAGGAMAEIDGNSDDSGPDYPCS